MMKHSGLIRSLAGLLLSVWFAHVHAQVNVTTFHYDVSRTGQNTNETILTPANVNTSQFGKLFSVPVDGTVYAQPLYLSGVNIGGGISNVLYVATENDSVYAMDADNGTVYAQASLIPSGGSVVSSVGDLGCSDNIPQIGITGTPVIDPTSGTLYVVAKSKVNGTIVQYLHALDVTTLAEKFGGPVLIQGSVPGSASDGSGGLVSFNSKQENQRAALLLTNGHVVISWASHCDNGPWHGWVMSYNSATLAQEAVFNTTPNGSEAGVWMSGGGPAADAAGNIYIPTGNGDWNGTSDFGDSILKLGPPANGKFPVLDYFTPYDQGSLNSTDTDVASGGLTLLPPLASGKVLLAQQGKAGTIVLLDTSNMGKYCVNLTPACTNGDPQIVQEIVNASSGIWGSPAYWNGNLYWTGANDTIHAYSFNANNSGLISTSPTSESAQIFAFSAPTPTVSSNGAKNGILWALDGSADNSTCNGGGSACLGLFAYDATNLANLLYISSQAANNRDSPGVAVKFENPIVANGKVYVGTQSSVSVYGLLVNAPPQATAPSFSPAAGTYSSAQQVTLSSTTVGASIYYTTNGTTPSTSSTLYSSASPIAVNSSMTIEAIAVASGYSNSQVATASYVIGGSGGSAAPVSLAGSANVDGIAANGAAVSGGGLDGNSTAYSATLLGSSIVWNGNIYNFGATGVADAISNVTVTLPAGNYSTLSLLGTGVDGNQPNQTFTVKYSDGTSTSFVQSLSDWYSPQGYSGESQVLAMPYRINSNGSIDGRTFYLYGYSFTLNPAKTAVSLTLPPNRNVVVLAIDAFAAGSPPPQAAAPTFSPAAGTYSSAQQVSLSSTTAGASIYYTTNGTTPSTSSTLYSSSPIAVNSSMTIEAITVASGYSNSQVASASYVINTPQAAAPSFSPAAGTYSSAQQVTLSSTTVGASIYYTTNGTTPSTSSTLYSSSSPIAVNSSMTIEAIAVASGYSNSQVVSASYVIGGSGGTAAPVSLAGSANVEGIGANGAAISGGGLDGNNTAYSGTLLGSSIGWNGNTYYFGATDVADAIANVTVALPAGNYGTLSLLGTGVDGNQPNQTFTVKNSDGTTTSFVQSLSDWYTPQKYSGESQVLAMPYRLNSNGSLDNRTFYLYGYTFTLNPAKTAVSLKLPSKRSVVVLAIDVH